MIVKIGWKVIITPFVLNFMRMQAVVHVMQAVATAADYYVIVGQNVVAKATANFHLICNHFSIRLQGRE